MLAVSTSWKSDGVPNGETLFTALSESGATSVELEYRITETVFHQMRDLLKRSPLRVVSVHNFFPAPIHVKGVRPGGDMFSLSDPDRELRELAVSWTTRTLEHANDLQASAVILHCGRVDVTDPMERLHHFFRTGRIESDAAIGFREQFQAAVNAAKPACLEGLLFSLDRLVREADRLNVCLALENRYHFNELPQYEDFDRLFSEFRGAPLGYWHDTGHAHAAELLGWVPADALLNRYADQLVGIHLHDADGLSDHLPPGRGEIDFDRLKPYLKPDTLRVMELKPGTPDAELAAGLAHLRQKRFDASSDSPPAQGEPDVPPVPPPAR